jgi:hypothetical protein
MLIGVDDSWDSYNAFFPLESSFSLKMETHLNRDCSQEGSSRIGDGIPNPLNYKRIAYSIVCFSILGILHRLYKATL